MTPVPLNSFKEPNREIASLRGKLPSVNFMTQRSAQEIVRNALEKDELDLLLVGIPEYQFLPKWSPASGNTDLTYLLDALYMGIADYTREELRERLHRAIRKIVGAYEGLDPVACCILCETVERTEGKLSLDLPLEEIAIELRHNIEQYKSRLIEDKSGAGSLWNDGRLGDLRRMSKNTEKRGGPSFCE